MTTTIQAAGTAATILGYPRLGRDRELKKALERHWRGDATLAELEESAARVRQQRLASMTTAGLDEVPVGDFSLYDHVLDTIWLVGADAARHRAAVPDITQPEGQLARYFAMARGTAEVTPLEMTKWFDTNYHYLVPEIAAEQTFELRPERLLCQIDEVMAAGHAARPVVVGPVTFLALAKPASESDGPPLGQLDRLVEVYLDLLGLLAARGVTWVQIDEPIAVTDLDDEHRALLGRALTRLAAADDRPKLLVGTYFSHLDAALPELLASGVEGLTLDLTHRGRATLNGLAEMTDTGSVTRWVAGVVDGRNVWRTDLDEAVALVQQLREIVGADAAVDVSSSCSLLHVPHDLRRESGFPQDVLPWLAFADQKLDELVALRRAIVEGLDAADHAFAASRRAVESRQSSPWGRDAEVRAASARTTDADLARQSAFSVRSGIQRERLGLPVLPTTTIGSFPQTTALRVARAGHRAGTLDHASYEQMMADEIESVVRFQESAGIDVLVHGEPERNDMVQYFADQLDGVLSSQHGWVQSYGSRCVRPPIIAGDVARPEAMTVRWSQLAASATDQPMKGMLTGPVTMLAWSFVREDQPRSETAKQMALALRREVQDLEKAGMAAIQVDEPALRETLPLRLADREEYLRWAVDAFRLTTAGVSDATQIHTHMCYAEFGEIMPAIEAMDADVISLEAARSQMEIVETLADEGYSRDVGPGVWDIHSPRVPSVDEIAAQLRNALAHVPAERLWVNPDCGLKTRGWAEVEASVRNLVAAAHRVRAELATAAGSPS